MNEGNEQVTLREIATMKTSILFIILFGYGLLAMHIVAGWEKIGMRAIESSEVK